MTPSVFGRFDDQAVEPAWLTWSDARRWVAEVLDSEAEARWLVEAASEMSPVELVLAASEPPSPSALATLVSLVERRAQGEPLQHCLGRWSFRGLDLVVDGRALVPRPETEVLVDVALGVLGELGEASEVPVVVDLGTGSGCVALALASESAATVWATDRVASALDLARVNCARLGAPSAERIHFRQGSWFEALPGDLAGHIDLAVSNPPYVSEAEWPDLPLDVRLGDPYEALVAGPEGSEAARAILDESRHWVREAGAVVLEVAPHQVGSLVRHALALGWRDVSVHADLTGRPRVLTARDRGPVR